MEDYKNSELGRRTAQKYADILYEERPNSAESLRRHPRMPLQNRAKIFAPFAALRGYDEELDDQRQRSEQENRGDARVDAEWLEYSIGLEDP